MRSFLVFLFVLVALPWVDAAASEKQPSISITSPTGWMLIINPHDVVLGHDAKSEASVFTHVPYQEFNYAELLAYFRHMYREAQALPAVPGKHDPKKLYKLALAEADFIDERIVLETDKIRAVFELAGEHPTAEAARSYAVARRKIPLLPTEK